MAHSPVISRAQGPHDMSHYFAAAHSRFTPRSTSARAHATAARRSDLATLPLQGLPSTSAKRQPTSLGRAHPKGDSQNAMYPALAAQAQHLIMLGPLHPAFACLSAWCPLAQLRDRLGHQAARRAVLNGHGPRLMLQRREPTAATAQCILLAPQCTSPRDSVHWARRASRAPAACPPA